MPSRATHYREKYSQGVIIRDNSLREYNHFLQNLGEKLSLEKIAANYIQKYGSCHILDIGCGNGQALHELKQHVGSLVHTSGMDLLPLHDKRTLDEFIEGDVHTSPLPQNNHIILSFRALHEMGGFSTLLPKIAHALAPGGRAYLWIRMRELDGNEPRFVREMNTREEKYLQELTGQTALNGCKVLVEGVEQLVNGARGSKSLTAGYVVLLLRSA